VLALLCFLRLGFNGRAVVAAFVVVVLAVLSAFDLEHRTLPNRIVLAAAAIALAGNVARAPDRWLEWTLAAVGAALFLLVPALAYPAGLGMGDVKLALLLGAALGTAVIPALLVGFFSAAAFGLALVVRDGPAARKAPIPFAPFLSLGAAFALLVA
jgi:leader peptidase (prepilin peptidase)/N-methyltransferase